MKTKKSKKARKVLKKPSPPKDPVIDPQDPVNVIKTVVAGICSVDVSAFSKEFMRSEEISWPRHIAMYFCREYLRMTHRQIALRFTRKHHTTVMNAEKMVRREIDGNDLRSLRLKLFTRCKVAIDQHPEFCIVQTPKAA